LRGRPARRPVCSRSAGLVYRTGTLAMVLPGGAWKSAVAARQGSLHWSKAYEVYPANDGEGVMVTAAMKLADVLLPWLKEDGAAQDLADSTRYPDVVSVIRNLPYLMSVLR